MGRRPISLWAKVAKHREPIQRLYGHLLAQNTVHRVLSTREEFFIVAQVNKATAYDFGAINHTASLFIHRHHTNNETILAQVATIAQDDVASIATPSPST